MTAPKIIIDPIFKSIIPPLLSDEFKGLEESIKSEGCRDAIVVWNNIIIDGHNRFEICSRNKIPFKVIDTTPELKTRDDVINWMYSNQLSRRNLTDESRTYLIGKQFEARKKREGGFHGNAYTKVSLPQNEVVMPSLPTSKKISTEQKVSRATVERAAEYSKAVDTIIKNVGTETLKQKILSRDINTTKKGIILLASTPVENQKKVIDSIIDGSAKSLQDAKRIVASENIKETPVISGKYKVIYADPPWEYGGSMNITYGTAAKHYPTMSLTDICNLPVKDICEDNSVLFLWTTSPQLEDAFKVINAWGFKYKASFIWDKVKHVMGHYNSVRHEFLLISTRGSCTPEVMKLFDSVVSEERTIHSKKPEVFRGIINTIYPSGNRIELFARENFENWKSWGNQI